VGYVQGEDLLTLTGEHQGIQESFDPVTGKLELKGPGGAEALYTDIIAAVYDIKFISNNPNPTDKSFSFTIGDANYLEETGHYYVYYEDLDVEWTEARDFAEDKFYYGLQGYLVTILSEEENQIAAVQTNDVGWIGASDFENEGDWRWVTGPEASYDNGNGLPFWSGDENGSPTFDPVTAQQMYSNWNDSGPFEPNDYGDNPGSENYAHVTAPGVGEIGDWNDLPNETNNDGDYQAKGYIVEFGGMPGDPVLNLSSSTNLLAPIVEISDFSGCLMN
jgi:hypothetical protein